MLNCAVTIMPIFQSSIGFIRRAADDDKFPGLLVAPGGKLEESDVGYHIGGVPYYTVEAAAVRELLEETGILVHYSKLWYFCSLFLHALNTLVISYWIDLGDTISSLEAIGFKGEVPGKVTSPGGLVTEFLTPDQIGSMLTSEFCPGMQDEALLLCEDQGIS